MRFFYFMECLYIYNVINLLSSNALDLDSDVKGKAGNLNAGAGRLGVREVSGIDLVDSLEVVHVLDKDVDLENLGHVRAAVLEETGDVLEDLMGLLLDILGLDSDEVALGVNGAGARDHNQTVELDGLGVGGTNGGGLLREHGFLDGGGRHT